MKHFLSIFLLFSVSQAFCQWELITPTEVEFGTSYYDIHFINKDTGFVTGHSRELNANYVARTIDAGETWDTTSVDDLELLRSTRLISIDFVNDSIGYISCTGDVLKTLDCGDTWISLDTADIMSGAVGWYNTIFVNKDTGYIAYQDGGAECLRTFDGGWTWEEDPIMTGTRSFNKNRDGLITGCTGGWAILDSETLEWDKGPGLYGGDLRGLVFAYSTYNNGQLILTGSRSGSYYGIYGVSEDEGETWRLFSMVGVLYEAGEIYFHNDLEGVMIGSFRGTLNTWDGGETWFLMEIENFDSDISERFTKLSMIDQNYGFAISQDGIYKTTNGGGDVITEVERREYVNIDEFVIKELEIFPNPVEDNIYFKNLDDENGRIIIYDINGAIVYDQLNTINKVNVSDLSAGQYFLNIYAENTLYSSQFVKK